MKTLFEKIEEDLTKSMKAHDAARLSTLRVLMASVKNAAIAARTSAKKVLDDADVQGVVRQETKKIKDALIDFSKAARMDLVKSAEAELKILSEYLPEAMSPDELKKIVANVVDTADSVKEFGKIMGQVMKEVKGRADGESVAAAVKEALAKKL